MRYFKAAMTFLKRFWRLVVIDFVVLIVDYFCILGVFALLDTSYWIEVYLQIMLFIILLSPFIVLAIAALIPNLLFPTCPSLGQWLGFATVMGLVYIILAALLNPAFEPIYYEDRLEVGTDTYYLSSTLGINEWLEFNVGRDFVHEYRIYRCDRLGLRCSDPHIERLQEQEVISHGKLRYNSYDNSLLIIIDDRIAAVYQIDDK